MEVRGRVFECIARICSVDIELITNETSIREFGADSLDAVELILELEEEFKIEIHDEGVKSMYEVKDILKAVEEAYNTN